jgi:Ion channel
MNDLSINTASVAAGALIVFAIFVDVFGTTILPRPMRSLRVSRLLWAAMWNGWRSQASRLSNEESREKLFGVYAPLTLLMIVFFWLASAIIGFGLITYGLRAGIRPEPRTLGEAIYAIGATVLTIGYGDYTPIAVPTRIVALFAATAGPGLFAITVTFLFSTLGSFQRREVFIATVDGLTGTPASGVHFLEMHAELGLIGDFPQSMREGRRWIAEILENHLAYPILPYFRSSHRGESWIGTLGALLDAAALAVSSLEEVPTGQARLLLASGIHLAADLAEYFIPSHNHDGHTDAEVGIERAEFEHALRSLREKGYVVRPAENAWPLFVSIRKEYASDLNVLARNINIPPAQWIGDRSLLARPGHAR